MTLLTKPVTREEVTDMKRKRAIRRYLSRKFRDFRKHLKVREWGIPLAAQHQDRRIARSWSGLEY